MITFESIEWKNFLSTGNNPTKILLNKSDTTLIVGQNGTGKSTLLDALSFGLFGKPHRNINKQQLINSINQKNCSVTIELKVDNVYYKIIRTIKPNTFEIYKNGDIINQDSKARDYQKILENNILKFNYKSFHQIIVLGSSSFVPFMQLPQWQRREIIEDLLDISIFSTMREIVKENISKLKEQINANDYDFNLIKEKISLKEDHINEIEKLNDEIITNKKAEQDEITDQIIKLQRQMGDQYNSISSNIVDIQENLDNLNITKNNIMQESSDLKSQIKNIVKGVKFYETNDHCPTCEQDISDELKTSHTIKAKELAKTLQSQMTLIEEKEIANNEKIAKVQTNLSAFQETRSQIKMNENLIEKMNDQIAAIDKQISEIENKDSDSSKTKIELDNLIQTRKNIEEVRYELLDNRLYFDAIYQLLLDTGIKTKIIKQYLPAINNFINNYLQVMDFFISFNLDETFDEDIRSRHRDTFKYESFSEGEKARIDLSLLFTWRQIAKMKNSISCNLLILDETFDSSLDYDGIDNLTKILSTLDKNTSTFVITHKADALEGKFRSKIEFVKEKNFSKIAA
jgi:DNA repair exonuclease SbcCD ATPase subunit